MLNLDWSDADLVLANSTCFDSSLLNKIAQKCSLLKKGTWLMTLTKKLPTAEEDCSDVEQEPLLKQIDLEWECVLSVKREMSWGQATVHLQRKVK